ncbi:phosphodiesterase [Thalassospira lohafexi]|uniref:Phosphodiesterase n=1 Tax=Thalassospira lohafexi TaxID=744227 RepID=A0A2N3L1X1_9PROT|nr:phosphodiesterase [Thalassospira lohafexi]PKR56736.1 phosphodiesterase [Thalassospira lohafexi]
MLIAQLTDLHVGAGRRLAYRKVDTARALENAVAHVEAMMPRPDVVLFTGDIGDLGTPDEYALVAEILKSLTIPYFMVPGNHDRRGPLRAAFADATPVAPGRDFVNYVVDDFDLRLIALDTLDEGKPGGVLQAEQLKWLRSVLADGDQKPSVIFMHHPPIVTGIAHMDAQKLETGADELAAIVSDHRDKVQAVLCGHVHRPIHTIWAGVPLIIGPSVAHQVALDLREDGPSAFVMEPPAMHLYVWDTDQKSLMTHLAYIDRFDGPHPFFGADGKLIV